MQWIYHEPVFECDRMNEDVLVHSPWAGHRNFAYDYVSNMKPKRIVELGSYYGCSAFAFMQAIKDHHLPTEFFAVDTWCGDSFTQTDYQEDIYAAFKQINDGCFSGVRSTMLRKTFDEACETFSDASIDLLHIDGSHNYEDVKNDYTRWRSKLHPDGVVFFHDVGHDLLFGEPMGSHIYWEELKRENPYTLEFPFSNGLGLLFASREMYCQVRDSFDPAHYQNLLNLQDTRNKDRIRKDHFVIRDLKYYNADLIGQTEILKHHLDRYQQDTAAADAYRQQLEQRCVDNAAALDAKEQQLQAANHSLDQLQADIQDRDDAILHLQKQTAEMLAYKDSKEAYIRELEQQKAELNRFADSKESYIRELEQQKAELNSFADSKESYIRELEQQIADFHNFAAEKERYIQDLEQQTADMKGLVSAKENYINELLNQKQELVDFAASKECYIQELEQQRAALNEFASAKDAYADQLLEENHALKDELDAQSAQYAQVLLCCDQLRAENVSLQQDLSTLLERIGKLPFGRRLYQDINYINHNKES